ELEAVLEQKSRKAEETAREISALKERVEEVRRKQNKADQAVQELQLKESEVNLRLDSLAERTAEECGIHLEAVELEPEQWRETPLFTEAQIEEFYEAEPEAPGEKVAQWYAQAKQENSEEEKQEDQGPRVVPLEEAVELRDEALAMADSDETNWDEVAERTDELRKKVERMGGANLDAIREQDELETRAEFLKQQKEDLEKARRHELEIIRELSTKSRESFRETFEAVRQNFQVLIRKLFGGGNGDLILDYGEEEEEDILEAGIEIKVRPPGKENRSISLLSGGEKALSAVALLFAIFESKPSPFCLLDEVDAPLDEANVGRFLSMLDEYRDDTQFVIVTHNKRTMSAAETLYGISMRENGVSNKLAVNFEELDRRLEQMKRESEQAGVRAKAG
ncbi:MAG: AAA family ATPase, partial [Planctomycetes bacterium]|nr:AAA family ATPase [Planctomycetota bacterium]